MENKKEFNYDNYEPIVYTKLEKCENEVTANCSDLSANIREDLEINIKENDSYNPALKWCEIRRLIENSKYLAEMKKQVTLYTELKYDIEDDGLTDYRIEKLKLAIADVEHANKRKLSYLVWIKENNVTQSDRIEKIEKLIIELEIYKEKKERTRKLITHDEWLNTWYGFFKNGK